MRRLLSLVAFFATVQASAQQVNPVPDYVFSNRMSAGRNTVTDTAAYFSIGPRYGATRGMMPPMVVDTASFSANKRNGLLIFSIQKNKFLYWDSVGVKWAEMAGTGGTAISSGDTAAMLSPYVRHAGYGLTKSGQSFLVDTLNISTRAWRQKGLDSLAALEVSGSGTTNYIPKFTASSTIGNSIAFDNGSEFLINTTTDAGDYKLQVSGNIYGTGNAIFAATSGSVGIGTTTPSEKLTIITTSGSSAILVQAPSSNAAYLEVAGNNANVRTRLQSSASDAWIGNITNHGFWFMTNNTERLRITSTGNIGIGTSTPSASSLLDINSTTQGFLPPRMTTAQRDAITSPANGLIIYNTTTSKLQVYATAWTDLH